MRRTQGDTPIISEKLQTCGSSGARAVYSWGMPVSMDPSRFEDLVDQALDEIPSELASLVQNCVVVIEPRAPEPDGDLLGYYDGIPLSERDSTYGGVLPDRIVIFRDAILDICETEADVVEEVRITVWHEVAHYFGIDDHQLGELGYA